MFVGAVFEGVAEIFIHGHSHLLGFRLRIFFDRFHSFRTARNVKDVFKVIQRFLRDFSQDSGAVSLEIAYESREIVLQMLRVPFPDRA